MKASKTLTSIVAASALVGAIGLAYAQTSGSTTPMQPTAPADQTMQNRGTTVTPGSSATTGPSAMPAAPAATPDAGMQMERPAQADRN